MSKKNKSFQPHNISVKSQNKSPKMADNYKPASSEQNGGKGIEKDLPANMPAMPKLPPELEKKLKDLKDKLDKFKAKVLEKFGDYIVGITLLPPEKAAQAPAPNNEKNSEEKVKEEVKSKEDIKKDEQKIQMLVIVDDTTSTKMTKDELHQKFSTIIQKIAEETDKNLEPQSVLLTDLWQNYTLWF